MTRVYVEIALDVTADRPLLDYMQSPEYRASMYNFKDDKDCLKHLAYNLMDGARLSTMDGFYELELGGVSVDGMVSVRRLETTVEVDEVDA